MAVPSVMADLSTTANSNSPAGTESPSNADDFLRAIQAIVRTTNAKGADIASATTTDIGAATGEFVDVTGTTTITGLGTVAAGIVRTVRFTGALTLTHNATSLILPGSANITTANGDVARFRSLGSGNWKCVGYIKQSGEPIAPYVDTNPIVKGSSDATKLVRLEVDGLTTATTRVLTVQDKDITIAGVSDVNGGIQLGSKIQYIGATVSSNALTITINPTTLDFRSTTLTDGTSTTVNLASAVTVVVPNTATLGTINATAARLAVLAINNAGTIEAAVVNLAGGNQLDETNLISTTAISAAAGSNNVIYSTTARASVAYRVIGFIDITEATAGTWATAPTKVQGSGGQALAALSSLGYGQTWQDVTGSRAASTTYYNTTGKPIMVALYVTLTTTRQAEVNGISVVQLSGPIGQGGAWFIVPAGSSYRINGSVSSIVVWSELR